MTVSSSATKIKGLMCSTKTFSKATIPWQLSNNGYCWCKQRMITGSSLSSWGRTMRPKDLSSDAFDNPGFTRDADTSGISDQSKGSMSCIRMFLLPTLSHGCIKSCSSIANWNWSLGSIMTQSALLHAKPLPPHGGLGPNSKLCHRLTVSSNTHRTTRESFVGQMMPRWAQVIFPGSASASSSLLTAITLRIELLQPRFPWNRGFSLLNHRLGWGPVRSL